ncbi:hypothetical protein KP509_11G081200 [Ceratopteris richardii]|nr:hypothetical protein KP509_11G081200 [Ceratopteris richardii]
MYAKCAALGKAQLVLDDLPYRNTISWNGLIAGYVQQGLGEAALRCYHMMQQDGLLPDEVTFSCVLKACGGILAYEKGQQTHADLVMRGLLEQDFVLGNALIDFYCKCGHLLEACQVFEYLPIRNVISWTALITGYCKHELFEEAICCFDQMKVENIFPDPITFASVLNACASIGLLEKGRGIHAEMVLFGSSESGSVLVNALIDMYAKCGVMERAELVFEELDVRDVASWNALIGGYYEHGFSEAAFQRYELMSSDSISPDEVTFTIILKVCISIGAIDKGGEIHAEIMRKDFLKTKNKLGSALVDMYAKCGALAKAEQVFKALQFQDASSWTSLIRGLHLFGYGEDAHKYLKQFIKTQLFLDVAALSSILNACGTVWAIDIGKELHAETVRRGLLEVDVMFGNLMVDMYAKFGMLSKAQQVLNELPIRTIVSWNSIMAGYCQAGYGERTLACYELMKLEGLMPDAVSFSSTLKACGSMRAIEKGREFHVEIVRQGLLEKVDVLGNGLLHMYIECGLLLVSKQVFNELPCPDVVSWNVLIAGHCQYNCNEDAIEYFDMMKHRGFSPDGDTFAYILKACGSIGAAAKGEEIHGEIILRGLLQTNPKVGSALVDMYSKCSELARASDVFDKLPSHDVVSWTALIGGYSEHGHAEEALARYEQMRCAGFSPDAVTLACILKACGCLGATQKGQIYFDSISKRYSIAPTVELHTSIVGIHGRTGHLDEAISLIKMMPSSMRPQVWLAFLGACQKWGNMELAKFAFEQGIYAAGDYCAL